MDEQTLTHHVDRQLESLRREFASALPPDRVSAIGWSQFEELRRDARINDFIPVLVYRNTREELVRIRRDDLRSAA